jgi:hypothetical protein
MTYSYLANGKLNAKVAPLPPPSFELFLAHILPSWASTIHLHIYKPKPVTPVKINPPTTASFDIDSKSMVARSITTILVLSALPSLTECLSYRHFHSRQ